MGVSNGSSNRYTTVNLFSVLADPNGVDAVVGITYNRRMINDALFGGATLLLASALAGCTLPPPPARILYQQDRTFVQLETDPSAGGMDTAGWNTHPRSEERRVGKGCSSRR